MKNTKKILSIFLALLMIISIIPMSSITAFAEDTPTSGTCGENVTWSFDETTGVLTISGTGGMYNYGTYNQPWISHRQSIITVIIEDGVTSIGKNAFFVYYELLANVTIPDSVITIDFNAFRKCTSLTSVTIPDSVTTIGEMAFEGCTNLADVTIGDGVTWIRDWAFSDCDSLTSVTIPDSVKTIGYGAFSYCTSLTNILIPESVTTIGDGAFDNCDSLTAITVDSNNQYYSSNEHGVLFNKDKTTLVQYPTGDTRTSYTIPDSVTTIGGSAFSGSDNLISVTIPDSVTTIGEFAFTGSDNLTSVTIPDSVTTIGDDAFEYCPSLTSVTIGDGVTTIGECAFSECPSLTSVTIGDGVTTIGENAFSRCTSLTSIMVDSNNQYYSSDEYGILYNKDKTTLIQYPIGSTETSYTIPEGVTTIGYRAFGNCNILTSVTIPDGVTTIGEYAFFDCNSLISATISDSVKTIDYSAFYSCNSFTDVYYSGTEEQWSAVTIGGSNDSLLNARIHYNSTGHICSFSEWTVVTEPTCTEAGSKTRSCSECGNVETEEISATGHSYNTSVTAPTCTTAGYTTYTCVECTYSYTDDETIATGHTAGEWETVLEPTYEADGKKVQKCTVCSEIVAEEVIPMLVKVTVSDEDTGVSMEFNEGDYNGEVKIVVEESFDGTAFDVIDTSLNASQKFIYDITMTVDGVATQTNGAVTIRIPLPAGYDPNRSFVYHVNTETGTVEKMPATYENGYLVFETTHFSYYAVVEEYNYSFSIQNPSRTEIRNKDGIILHAVVDGTAPSGSYVKWESSNGNFDKSADGSNLKIIAKNKGWTTFTAILCDADGNELARDSVEMYSKSGFFDKIGGFFRGLFGMTKIYEN